MSDCKCLMSTYDFRVYKRQSKWWEKLLTSNYPVERKVITVHGNTMEELEDQAKLITSTLAKRYSVHEYVIWRWVV